MLRISSNWIGISFHILHIRTLDNHNSACRFEKRHGGSPVLVVLDEPNASLDDLGERALAEAIQRLKAEGVTLFVISHLVSLLRGMDRLLVLREGQIHLYGPTEQVMERMQAKPAPIPVLQVPPAVPWRLSPPGDADPRPGAGRLPGLVHHRLPGGGVLPTDRPASRGWHRARNPGGRRRPGRGRPAAGGDRRYPGQQRTADRAHPVPGGSCHRTAPVAGTVVERRVHSIGDVVRSGDPLLDIVPGNDRFVVEARLADRDVNQLYLPAEVMIRTGGRTFASYIAKTITDMLARAIREE